MQGFLDTGSATVQPGPAADVGEIKIVAIAQGRFHHFDLARELAARGALRRFYTGYPKFQMRKHRFYEPAVVTFPWLVAPYMALGRFGCLPAFSVRLFERLIPWTLDWFAAATMPPCDALVALSQAGLRAGAKVRARGGIYVCDRGSSHIRHQNDILVEEFARWGGTFRGIDRWVMAREEAEYAAADVITVPSGFALESFVARGVPREKLRAVPYGVDLEKFAPAGRPAPDRFDVLFAGQIGFRKGVPDLLDAFARLDHPRKRLRLAGTVRDEMQAYLRQHPQPPNVEFLGHADQPALQTLMSESHVLVLPSIEEGLALVMAQAMACGCPIIATENSGARNLFEDGMEGFVIPIRAPEILAARLTTLAAQPALRDAMGAAALRKVASLGGWQDYGAAMFNLINELTSARRAVRNKTSFCEQKEAKKLL